MNYGLKQNEKSLAAHSKASTAHRLRNTIYYITSLFNSFEIYLIITVLLFLFN